MTEQLKPLPCPFCGHTGLSFEDGSTYRWGIASCNGCGATCGEVRRNYPDDGAWHAAAAEAWNRRTQPAQAVPVLTRDEVDACFDGLMPSGSGKSRYDIANQIEQAVRAKMGVAVPPDVVRDADVEAAAKKMAEIFDYPWDFMPEKGRNTMRENVRAVLGAAIAQQKGGV